MTTIMTLINSTENRMRTQNRLSNFETLRIIAMLLVMITHCSFLAFGVPTYTDTHDTPLYAISIFSAQSLSCICVNLFVLISGWFGININKSKVIKLIGQVIFFSILVYFVLLYYDHSRYCNLKSASTILMLNTSDYWFIKAYIGLMIISPILNKFIENTNKRTFEIFLVSFYIFQTIYGWLSIDGASWLGGGYSAFSFIGLYMLARYFRLYDGVWKYKNKNLWIICFFGIVAFQAILAYIVTYINIPVAGRLFTYTNPLVIIQGLVLLFYFSKLKFESRIINWIASSCVAVYLLHANELVLRSYYGPFVKSLYDYNTSAIFFLKLILFLFIVFFTAIFLDKLRIALFNLLTPKKNK